MNCRSIDRQSSSINQSVLPLRRCLQHWPRSLISPTTHARGNLPRECLKKFFALTLKQNILLKMKVVLNLHWFSLLSHAWIGQTLSTRNEFCRTLQRWMTIQADEGPSEWRPEVAPSMPMSQSQQKLQGQKIKNQKNASRMSHTTQTKFEDLRKSGSER